MYKDIVVVDHKQDVIYDVICDLLNHIIVIIFYYVMLNLGLPCHRSCVWIACFW